MGRHSAARGACLHKERRSLARRFCVDSSRGSQRNLFTEGNQKNKGFGLFGMIDPPKPQMTPKEMIQCLIFTRL